VGVASGVPQGGRPLLIDGTLNGLASFAQRSGGVARAGADWQPAPVRLLVMIGHPGAVLWSWRHG
jgi:hypothetical protein